MFWYLLTPNEIDYFENSNSDVRAFCQIRNKMSKWFEFVSLLKRSELNKHRIPWNQVIVTFLFY
jgi:hypothetical protein